MWIFYCKGVGRHPNPQVVQGSTIPSKRMGCFKDSDFLGFSFLHPPLPCDLLAPHATPCCSPSAFHHELKHPKALTRCSCPILTFQSSNKPLYKLPSLRYSATATLNWLRHRDSHLLLSRHLVTQFLVINQPITYDIQLIPFLQEIPHSLHLLSRKGP